jgi:hypothetical protein
LYGSPGGPHVGYGSLQPPVVLVLLVPLVVLVLPSVPELLVSGPVVLVLLVPLVSGPVLLVPGPVLVLLVPSVPLVVLVLLVPLVSGPVVLVLLVPVCAGPVEDVSFGPVVLVDDVPEVVSPALVPDSPSVSSSAVAVKSPRSPLRGMHAAPASASDRIVKGVRRRRSMMPVISRAPPIP